MPIWLLLVNAFFVILTIYICELINKWRLKRRIIRTVKKEFPNATVQVEINMIQDVEVIVRDKKIPEEETK